MLIDASPQGKRWRRADWSPYTGRSRMPAMCRVGSLGFRANISGVRWDDVSLRINAVHFTHAHEGKDLTRSGHSPAGASWQAIYSRQPVFGRSIANCMKTTPRKS